MLFSFKTKPEDFFVKEELNFQLNGIGDFFYILFEKKGLNTMDIINLLCRNFNLKRSNIGITGLKDKDGITQQRLSISKKYLNNCGGEKNLLSFLKDFVVIIQTGRHDQPLSVGQNKGNHFVIRLRKKSQIPDSIKNVLEKNIENSLETPFPNIYGFQRFGKGNKNFKKVLKLLSGEETLKDNYEVKFTLQTFGSLWFNEYAMRRRENKEFLLEGDIMVNGRNAFGTQIATYTNNKLSHFDYRKEKESIEGYPFREPKTYLWDSDYTIGKRFPTGPVLGTEQLVCKNGTLGREHDNSILKESLFLDSGYKLLKHFKIYGYRRPLRILPKNLQWDREDGDLIIKFFLPTGSYATSYLTFIFNEIDPKGCESNNLKIPRITQIL